MTTTLATPTLTAQDRCDACGAAAQVGLSNGLLLCTHHHNQHASALAAKGVTVTQNALGLSESQVEALYAKYGQA